MRISLALNPSIPVVMAGTPTCYTVSEMLELVLVEILVFGGNQLLFISEIGFDFPTVIVINPDGTFCSVEFEYDVAL